MPNTHKIFTSTSDQIISNWRDLNPIPPTATTSEFESALNTEEKSNEIEPTAESASSVSSTP